jgi:hypothetical protein
MMVVHTCTASAEYEQVRRFQKQGERGVTCHGWNSHICRFSFHEYATMGMFHTTFFLFSHVPAFF